MPLWLCPSDNRRAPVGGGECQPDGLPVGQTFRWLCQQNNLFGGAWIFEAESAPGYVAAPKAYPNKEPLDPRGCIADWLKVADLDREDPAADVSDEAIVQAAKARGLTLTAESSRG